MNLRTLLCAVLGLSLLGCEVYGGDRRDVPNRGGYADHDRRDDRRRNDDRYRNDDRRNVIILHQRNDRRFDQGYRNSYNSRHDPRFGPRDNRRYNGYREPPRAWNQPPRGGHYYAPPSHRPPVYRPDNRGVIRLYIR